MSYQLLVNRISQKLKNLIEFEYKSKFGGNLKITLWAWRVGVGVAPTQDKTVVDADPPGNCVRILNSPSSPKAFSTKLQNANFKLKIEIKIIFQRKRQTNRRVVFLNPPSKTKFHHFIFLPPTTITYK